MGLGFLTLPTWSGEPHAEKLVECSLSMEAPRVPDENKLKSTLKGLLLNLQPRTHIILRDKIQLNLSLQKDKQWINKLPRWMEKNTELRLTCSLELNYSP